MWGDEPQLEAFRERLKLLLEVHQQELNPRPVTAKEGDVLFHQGDPVDTLLLLTSGKVAVVEAVELLGEVDFFANGQHYADFRVVDGAAELLALPGEDLLQAMLFDSDLAVEMLALVSERCRRGNRVIGLLLSGIEAVHDHETESLEQTTTELGGIHFCIAKASRQLKRLHQQGAAWSSGQR